MNEHLGIALLKAKSGQKNWLSLERHVDDARVRDHAASTCEGDDPPDEEWLPERGRHIYVQPALQQGIAHRLCDLLLAKLRARDPHAKLSLDRMVTNFGSVPVTSGIALHVDGIITNVDESGEFTLVTVTYDVYGVTKKPSFQTGFMMLRYQPG